VTSFGLRALLPSYGGSDHDGRVVPETRWARTIDGASIAYQELGEGPIALVVIHGWVSHLEVYWEQPRFARLMRRLARDLHVVHFDKRGTGMSDRVVWEIDLESRMDDVRAVMDAIGIERAALLGWGTGGAALALFFAAAQPERTLAVCTDGNLLEREVADYRWGTAAEAFERELETDVENWGTEVGIAEMLALTGSWDHADVVDPALVTWLARFMRFSATPTSYAAFARMWWETDVRRILPSVRAPVAVFYKVNAPEYWGNREQAEYLASQLPDARVVAVEGRAPVVWLEDPESLVAMVEKFIGSIADEEADFDRGLATVLFTDIVGSSQTAARIGDRAWREVVERHHHTVRTLLARYRGKEIDTAGDGFFASFEGPARAVRCGQAIVQASKTQGLEIRAGVHTGEVQTIGGKIGGIAVNIGARVGSVAAPSQVLVSQTVKDLTAGSGLVFEDAGEHELKGIPDRWRLFEAIPARP
jgi:class 3 adenylate cyclase